MADAHENWIVELYAGMDEKQRNQLYDLLAVVKTSASAATAKKK
jgi:hypothetical protein